VRNIQWANGDHLMSRAMSQDWQSINQTRLTAALAEIKSGLRLHAGPVGPGVGNGSPDPPEAAQPDSDRGPKASAPDVNQRVAEATRLADERPTALDVLCASFNLTRFERDTLLLCAGIELDSTFAPLCAAAQLDTGRSYPTFSLALAALPDAHWSALAPDAPLRRWRLIDVGAGPGLTVAPLRIDERVLHYLAGVPQLDDQLAGMVEPIMPATIADLAPSHAAVAQSIVAAWSVPRVRQDLPAVQLCSADLIDCRPVASAAAATMELQAIALSSDLIPTAAAELEAFLRLWEREAALGGALLLVECDPDSAAEDSARSRSAARLIARFDGPIIVCTREPRRIAHRQSINFNVNRPTACEQRAAWQAALPQGSDTARVNAIASQFSMTFQAIRSTAAEAVARAAASPGLDISEAAWDACRARCRTKLDGLAQRIEPAAGWDDLVLPDPQMQSLRQIAVHVRHGATVYDTWGFAAKSSRGLGIAALFAGPSGTGKTRAAEVLAAELRLDLYRIDLASVVSKYIGETEKNLRKVFDAAEESGAILLFDEADALFGKRSEVKDSHDRYANIEVSYLLQRVEAYRGLAILTTNLKTAIDSAFLRRLRFVVQFPFPDAAQRAEIWRRVFPKQTPTLGLVATQLAKLNIPGGNIRNIALNAAFLAAAVGQPVGMSHVKAAAQSEYLKLERPLTAPEIVGFI
jgi:hypothetical protein